MLRSSLFPLLFLIKPPRPHSQRYSITSPILDATTYLYWPSQYFEKEFILIDSDSESFPAWKIVAKDASNVPRATDTEVEDESLYFKSKSSSFPPRTWRIGVISGCFVGICCTEQTSIDRSDCEDASFEVISTLNFTNLLSVMAR